MTTSALRSLVLLTLFISAVAVVNAQKGGGGSVIMAVGHDFKGCHNGQRDTPELQCTGAQWQGGNMGSSDAQWVEGEFVAIRDVITGLTPGSTGNTISFDYDTTKGGKHAFDYLGTYDTSTGPPNGPGGNDPCSGVTCVGSPSTFGIPHDPNITTFLEPGGRAFTMWNATITNVSVPTLFSGSYAGDSTTRITVTFDVAAGQSTAVLAFGAHVGSRLDWGVGNSAVAVNGSPYHINIVGGGGGTVQMSANAAIFPSFITIIKQVSTLPDVPGNPPGTTSTFSFGFTYNQGTTNSTFSLIDDVVGNGGGSPLSANATEVFAVTTFGTGSPITIQENSYAPTWTLSGLSCVSTAGGLPNDASNNTITPGTRTVAIVAEEAELTVCTYTNSQFQPTAAPALISGRTVDSFGNGIGGTRITLTNAQTGESFIAISNPFGYYSMEAEVGNFYVMSVSNKRYTFSDGTRTFSLNENLSDVDFVADPRF